MAISELCQGVCVYVRDRAFIKTTWTDPMLLGRIRQIGVEKWKTLMVQRGVEYEDKAQK